MIVAMAAHSNEPECEVIYHVGSSFSNPVKYNDVKNFGRFYFTRTPWINKDGKAVKVGDVTVLSSMPSFRRYMAIRYLLPLKARLTYFYLLTNFAKKIKMRVQWHQLGLCMNQCDLSGNKLNL